MTVQKAIDEHACCKSYEQKMERIKGYSAGLGGGAAAGILVTGVACALTGPVWWTLAIAGSLGATAIGGGAAYVIEEHHMIPLMEDEAK